PAAVPSTPGGGRPAFSPTRRPRRPAVAADRPRAGERSIAAESLDPRRLLSKTQPFIEDPRDTVFDAARNLLYLTTGHGTVECIDLGTMSKLSPWSVGTELNGAQIAPDGSILYAVDGSGYDQPVLHEINLSTGAVTHLPYQ